jgi:hypothetical protein
MSKKRRKLDNVVMRPMDKKVIVCPLVKARE